MADAEGAPPAAAPQAEGEKAPEVELTPEQQQQDKFIKGLHARITENFQLFDDYNNHTIERKLVGVVIRSLGMCPTEGELEDVTREIEEDDTVQFVKLERFLPVATKLMVEKRFPPVTEEKLLRCFQFLDKDGRGLIPAELLTKLMTEYGEKFSQEEIEMMMMSAKSEEDEFVRYKDYVPQLISEVDDDEV